MIITIDVGNTHIVTGIHDFEGNLLLSFRVSTNEKMTEDEYFSYFRNISSFNDLEVKKVCAVVISSVVPNLIAIFQYFSKKYFNLEPLIINLDCKLPFKLADNMIIPSPNEFGGDRIIDIVGAMDDNPNKNLIIWDFGTATTYEVIKDNIYVGGGILPGIEMTLNSLYGDTAKLPKVKFSTPTSVLGYSTITQIQSGVFYGYAGQIRYIINKIKEEINDDAKVIATGGLGRILSAEIDEINEYDPDLALKGLFSVYKSNI